MPAKRTPLERRLRPDVPVTIDVDGKKRAFRLCYDFNALARFEEETGVDCLNVSAPWAKMGAGRLGAFFWAGALIHQPEYDSDEGLATLRSLLDVENSTAVFEACWEAYMLYLPKAQAELMRAARKSAEESAKSPDEDPQTPAQIPPRESAGENSGQSRASTSASRSANSAS